MLRGGVVSVGALSLLPALSPCDWVARVCTGYDAAMLFRYILLTMELINVGSMKEL